jgi:tetratricopeptide (TPR) repeat protein
MKRIVTLFIFSLIVTSMFAQRGKVTTALSLKESGEILKAFKAIEEAIDPTNVKSEKSITWPRTWEVRGQILQEAYKKGVTGLVDEPLFASYDSYLKAIEYDEGSKLAKSIIIDLTFLQTDLSNYAIVSYEKQRFDISLKCFELYLAIGALPIMNQSSGGQLVVDTAIVYNAGLAAYKAQNWDKSIEYFSKSAKLDYNGPASYTFTFKSYLEKGDTLNYIKTLKEGFGAYPNDENLLVELINFYISKGKSDDAIKYIDLAISEKPTNATLYTAKGSMLEKMGRIEDAIELYKKAVVIDSNQFAPYYNLSVIYYNRGVEVINGANQLPPSQTEKYDAEIEKAKEHFRQSLPFIEKAYTIDSTEIAIIESLKTIYYRLQINDKYMEINKKIQSLKQ